MFPNTVLPRDFDTIEIPFPERGEPRAGPLGGAAAEEQPARTRSGGVVEERSRRSRAAERAGRLTWPPPASASRPTGWCSSACVPSTPTSCSSCCATRASRARCMPWRSAERRRDGRRPGEQARALGALRLRAVAAARPADGRVVGRGGLQHTSSAAATRSRSPGRSCRRDGARASRRSSHARPSRWRSTTLACARSSPSRCRQRRLAAGDGEERLRLRARDRPRRTPARSLPAKPTAQTPEALLRSRSRPL